MDACTLRGAEEALLGGFRQRMVAEGMSPEKEPLLIALAKMELAALCLAVELDSRDFFSSYVRWLSVAVAKEGASASDVLRVMRTLLQGTEDVRGRTGVRELRVMLRRAVEQSAAGGRVERPPFVTALLSGDFADARARARQALHYGYGHLYEDIIQPALEEVGELWSRGEVSVADEHRATALARNVVASLYPSLPWPNWGPKAVLTCVEGEQHDFGLQLFADLLALEGWQTVLYGANTPTEDFAKKVREEEGVVFVGFSASRGELFPALKQAVAALRRDSPDIRILVGGNILKDCAADVRSLPSVFSAPNATAAVRMASEWRQAEAVAH